VFASRPGRRFVPARDFLVEGGDEPVEGDLQGDTERARFDDVQPPLAALAPAHERLGLAQPPGAFLLGHSGTYAASTVVRTTASELAPEGRPVDPSVLAVDGDGPFVRIRTVSGVRDAAWKGFAAPGTGVDQPRVFRDGQLVFFKVWDDTELSDSLVGGFVVDPASRDGRGEYTAKIHWDWKAPQSVSHPRCARGAIRFIRRRAASSAGTVPEVKR
jgi:hypothetical protein